MRLSRQKAITLGLCVSLVVPLPILYQSRWGILGIVGIGPFKETCSDLEALNTYLNSGGDPSAYVGKIPLIVCAAEANREDVVAHLLELGVDVESPTKPIFTFKGMHGGKTTPLYHAARVGSVDTVKLLLKNGADPIRGGDYYLDTPLNVTIEYGQVEVLRLFLESHNFQEIADEIYSGSISQAARNKKPEMLRFLAEQKLLTNSRYSQQLTSTALKAAIQIGDLEMVKLMLSAGADINGDKTRYTPLHVASAKGDIVIAKFLLGQSVDVNIGQSEASGYPYETPIFDAAQSGHIELVRLLIESGAKVNLKANRGNTLLHYAVAPIPYLDSYHDYRPTKAEIIRLLIANDIDVNATNDAGKTALDLAKKRNRRKEIINLLVEAGAVSGTDDALENR